MLTALLVGVGAVACHIWVKGFVARRLRFTPVVQKRQTGLVAAVVVGVIAAVASGVVLGILPFIGPGAWGLAIGAGAGMGVLSGRKAAHGRKLLED